MDFEKGPPYPLGPELLNNKVKISLFSEADKVDINIYKPDTYEKIESKTLFKTAQIHHALIPQKELIYNFTVNGKEIIDPYSHRLINVEKKPLSIFKESLFDWGDDKKPGIKKEDLIIYEMHVKGFTKDPSSKVSHPGTYLGLIEKLPHLKSLGINAIELLPIHQINPFEVIQKDSSGNPLTNYWGYSTISFFAPSYHYADKDPENELKELVKACHKLNIEVIMDVVYNHTAEGNEKGPTYHFKELGKEDYYITEKGNFLNYSGCGNTTNGNNPIMLNLVLDSLRHFALNYHIDGFRFDLASTFARGQNGSPLFPSPLVEAITKDPFLSDIKLIAEPWDLELYQVGGFYPFSSRWSDWNGRYRDVIRSFIKGDSNAKNMFATRISGSQDLYHWDNPTASVNFVVAHDGFTLKDLVSYNDKHNEANGEQNKDGMNENVSWNCGFEGGTDDPLINKLRLKQMKNFIIALFSSRGIPMFHMGDEYGHTKCGNNNTWCQDNPLSWFNWNALENSELFEFTKKMIQIRKENPSLTRPEFLSPENTIWHGLKAGEPAWNQDDKFLALEMKDDHLYVAFNASDKDVKVKMPEGEFKELIYSGSNPLKREKEEIGMEPYSSVILKKITKP